MKPSIQFNSLVLLLFTFIIGSCQKKEECMNSYTYTTQTPIYQSYDSLRLIPITFSSQERSVEHSGKIYTYQGYLFINEVNEGIHIFDNRNPLVPKYEGFINILGNVDIAIRNNILYADSYMDLLVIDITNIHEPTVVERIEWAFQRTYFGMGCWADDQGIIVGWNSEEVTVVYSCDEEPPIIDDGWYMEGDGGLPTPSGGSSGDMANNANGVGGSMARFAMNENYLYTLGDGMMQIFNISSLRSPIQEESMELNWDIETLFAYQDKLFVGTASGMWILSTNSSRPEVLSIYEHVSSCDPVVVQGNLAYVTLRSGNECQGFNNQLEVVDISDPRNPQQVAVYPMFNPHGLGIDGSSLFICDGDEGLKIFDATDELNIQQRFTYSNINAFDVIPLQGLLLMVGNDGLYQYDYSNPSDVHLLSVIPFINNGGDSEDGNG